MEVRVVLDGQDERIFTDIPVDGSTDAQLIALVEGRLEKDLKGYTLTRHEENIVIHPTPVFG